MSLAQGRGLVPMKFSRRLGPAAWARFTARRILALDVKSPSKSCRRNSRQIPGACRRFELEARAAAALSHPNILAVYDIGSHERLRPERGANAPSESERGWGPASEEKVPYIVSELLEGETLRDRLRDGAAALSVHKAVDYAIQIARGLAAAHDKGIVHPDLKPENVFVTTDERVKILDFGLAKLAKDEPAALSGLPTSPPPTEAGVVLGTVGYMSPEQVRGLTETMTAILNENPPDFPMAERPYPASIGPHSHALPRKDTAVRSDRRHS